MKINQIFTIFILLLAVINPIWAQQEIKFSSEAIEQDFEYLRNALEDAHYNLYAYTPKEVFNRHYKKTENSIKDSMTSLQAFRLFQPYVALAKMSHCELGYPFNIYFGNYAAHGGIVFPLNICFFQKKILIKNNYSNEANIPVGDELISLNRRPMTEVMNDFYNFYSGESDYCINSNVDWITFSRMYWFVFGQCDTFNLKIKKKNGSKVELNVPAIPVYEFEDKIRNEPIMNYKREYKFFKEIAYVQPGPFMNVKYDGDNNPNMLDNTMYLHFLDSCFTEIHKRKSKYLIVDIRNNPGGVNSFSMPLISYFAAKSFSSNIKVIYKTSEVTKEGVKDLKDSLLSAEDIKLKNELLSHKNGSYFEVKSNEVYLPKNDSVSFRGKVFVLINRFTYSQAIVAASLIQDYEFGTIIGEPTPYAATMYASTQSFELPNTKIRVTYPRAFLQRKNKNSSLESLIPDFLIKENPISDKDEIMYNTIKLIDKMK